jgi:hypothetical protein
LCHHSTALPGRLAILAPAGEMDFMRKLLGFFIGMIVGAGLMTFAFKYHVMYSKDGLAVIPKSQAGLRFIR